MKRSLGTICAAVLLLSLFRAAPASAGGLACNASAGVVHVDIEPGGAVATLFVGSQMSVFQGSVTQTCNGAPTPTVNNIDTIIFDGTSTNDAVAIDLRFGKFAPGASAETTKPEIEINVDLGAGTDDSFAVDGMTKADTFTFGAASGTPTTPEVDLNKDGDGDVTLANVELIVVRGHEGDDTISAAGNGGTLPVSSPIHVYFQGDDGDDTLLGSGLDDSLDGGTGADVLKGFGGLDSYFGEGGKDKIKAADGEADTTINCGTGNDSAKIDQTIDVTTDCETVIEVV